MKRASELDPVDRPVSATYQIRFERVGALPSSLEEGTPAAEMSGHLSETETRDRFEALTELQRQISFEKG